MLLGFISLPLTDLNHESRGKLSLLKVYYINLNFALASYPVPVYISPGNFPESDWKAYFTHFPLCQELHYELSALKYYVSFGQKLNKQHYFIGLICIYLSYIKSQHFSSAFFDVLNSPTSI